MNAQHIWMDGMKMKKIQEYFKKLFTYNTKQKALMFIFWGFFCFFIGFHNMDQGQNLMRLNLIVENELNMTMVETNGLGMQISLENTYRSGCVLMLFSVVFLFIAGYYYALLKDPSSCNCQIDQKPNISHTDFQKPVPDKL